MYEQDAVACHLCFRDRTLRTWIKGESTVRGICPWCGRRGHLVPLEKLAAPFREVADIYAETSGPDAFEIGELLSVLFDDDWGVFSDEIQSLDRAQELLTSILQADLSGKARLDYPDFGGLFCRQSSSLQNAWDERAYSALQGEVSKGLSEGPDNDRIADEPPGSLAIALEDMSIILEPGQTLYRARIHEDRLRTSRFTAAEVGAPPAEKVKAARANQAKQPVLYLARNKSTALAEVRPWKGAVVALATAVPNRRLILVDLAKRQPVESPFFVELLKWRSKLAGLLSRLGQDMSRPVMPHEQDVLYKPTQLLALMIQRAGYDGCIYPSAMGSGKNFVLFDTNAADIVNVEYVRVSRAAFYSSPLSKYDSVYDESPYDYALPGE